MTPNKQARALILAWKPIPPDLAPQVTNLDLRGTRVSDLTPLAALTSLQRLDLGGTRVSDVTPLAALASLQSLYLAGTRVSDLTPLAALVDRGLNIYR